MKYLFKVFAPFLVCGIAFSANATQLDSAADQKFITDNLVRQISFDICLPASAEEYEELGKYAIIALDSSTAISTELPLRSVYLTHKGVRIPLQKVVELVKKEAPNGSGATQTSFYLVPIQMMKSDAKLLADFKGERKGFGITTFSEREGLDPAAPAFARLDAYNVPFDPDMNAVKRVILREFPSYFP